MVEFLIWGAFTVLVAAFCVWRPDPARIFVGLFFGMMGLGVHGALIFTNPQGYTDFAANAPWAIYQDVGTWLTEPNPAAFGIFMLTFETTTAALILSRGRAVKWGLLAAIGFLIGITPLGLEEVPNLILAAGMGFLLTRDFPTALWTMLSRHRRRRHSTAVRGAAAPRAHTPGKGMRPGPPRSAPHRSEAAPPLQARAESLERVTGGDRRHGEFPPAPVPMTGA